MTDRDAGPAATNETIAGILSCIAGQAGDRIAVDDGARQLTYRALATEAARLAQRIEAQVPHGQPVGLILPMAADYIVAIVAIMIGGRPYVALDPSFPPLQHARIAEYAGLAAVLVDDAGAGIMADAVPSLLRIPVVSPIAPGPAPEIRLGAGSDAPAFIYYTSGSTGRPKGVIYDQGNLVEEIHGYIAALSIGPADRISMLYRPSASAGTRDIFAALLAGARLCIVDLKRYGTNEARRRLDAHGITIYHSAPPVFRAVMGGQAHFAERFEALRVVHLIGDRIVPDDLALVRRRFAPDCRLYIDVATTETFSYASWLVDPAIAVENDLVAVGRARSESGLRLIDDAGHPTPKGVPGEIVVTTTSAARGYWRDPETTATRFRLSAVVPGAIDYHTGDIGCFRPNGLLDFIGRKDRQVKIAGNTVHPGAVEATIAAMPGIAAIAIIVRSSVSDAAMVAYWVDASSGGVTAAAIRDWCLARLPAFMCPTEMVCVGELPLLGTGKTDYAALGMLDRTRLDAAKITEPAVGDRPALMGIVRAAWEKFLPGTFDQDRSFEASGGDSLNALSLFALLEERLGRSLPLSILSRSATPSDLIVALKGELEPSASIVEKPVMFFFPGLYANGADIAASELGHRLSEHFDVRLVDYRRGGEELRGQFQPGRLFDDLVREMSQAAGEIPIWVLGYSYGARIAAEALRLADQAGVRVARMINLDGVIEGEIKGMDVVRGLRTRVRQGSGSRGGFFKYLFGGLAYRTSRYLLRHRWLRALRLELSLLLAIGWDVPHRRCRIEAVATLRRTAFGEIPRGKIPTPMTLLTANDTGFDRARFPDLGWRRFSDNLDLRVIGGTHAKMLAQEIDRLVSEIISIKEAQDGAL
ncbi:MAG TPA: AMP-binding protein [Aliidongia sp.]|uniref:AMP-binding protein n=1 Tax=Aliidongia sp. TaxID=1914230 RepID=UPI002DDD49EE|nr:AMP-binding protein [Aliidongia sp.]HEV2677514.1 AMP-binding protein [Aliidongia sp.]